MKLFQRGWLKAPAYPESLEKNRVARLLNTFILLAILINLLALGVGVPFFFSYKILSAGLVLFFLVMTLVSWGFLRKGWLNRSAGFLLVGVHLAAVLNTYANGGIASKDNLFFAAPVVLSPLLLEVRWAWVSVGFVFVELSAFAWLGWAGVEIPRVLPGVPLGVWFLGVLILALLYQAIRLSVDGWTRSLDLANRELTERRRTETERDDLKQRLFQAQKMESLGRMAGGVAHDFKNLLMVINDRLEAIKAVHYEDEALIADITRVEEALQKAEGMTRSLLDFSKNRVLRLEKIELDDLVLKGQPVLVQLLGTKKQLRMDLGAKGAMVLADRSGLEQVLINLTVNAREALAPGGLLVIRTDVQEGEKGSTVRLSVKDNGRGMTAEVRERVFEPFYTTKEKGTGLGLATVFGVVQQLGGTLEVDSAPGQGTTFRIHLPRV